MDHRSRKFVDCIQEMEATEEILQRKWQQIHTSGPSRSKSGIEKLFTKLRERQSTTSAALQALDAYERLRGERSDFRGRKEAVLHAFQKWLSHDEAEGGSSGSGNDEDMDEDEKGVLRKYKEFQELSRTFATKWTHIRKSDKKVAKKLKNLNSCLSTFPRRLRTMEHTRIASVKWPNSQCQKLSAAVELAFDQITFMTKLLNEIDDKLESLEVFFRLNKSSIALESREDAAANEDAEDEELSEHEDQSADEMEED